MNNRVRYTRQNIISNSYYQLPKFLFEAEFAGLTNDARVLYALLRNRHEISIKNEWFDDNGEVFLYFKREDMQEILHLSDKTVTKAINNLKDFALLEEVKQGFMKPNRIYLLCAMVEQFGIGTAETLENTMTRKSYESRHGDFTTHDTEILRVNKNHNNKIQNNIIQNNQSSQSVNDGQDETDYGAEIHKITEQIKTGICYSEFVKERSPYIKLIDEFIAVILDAVATSSPTAKINGEHKPRELVRHNLMSLTYSDIQFVIEQYIGIIEPIKNKRQYILTMLYNAKMENQAGLINGQ